MWGGRIGRDESVEESKEVLGGARGKGVDRMGDDVGVDVFVEVEADGTAARACVLLIVVGANWAYVLWRFGRGEM